MGQINTIHKDRFSIWNSDGNAVLGLIQTNFTIYLYNPNGIEVGGITITEIGNGIYESAFTPNIEGPWSLKIIHITYLPTGLLGVYEVDDSSFDTIENKIDSIYTDTNTIIPSLITGEHTTTKSYLKTEIDANETKIDTIDTNVDSILGHTDTLEADLKTYMDVLESDISGYIEIHDNNLDSAETTVSALIGTSEGNIRGLGNNDLTELYTEINENETKLDTIDTNVDSILEDTNLTIPNFITSKHSVTDGLVTTVDGIVDTILIDTDSTIPTLITLNESNIRGIDNDTLKIISDQIDDIDVNTDGIESALDNIEALTTRVLGLSQENFKINAVVRNDDNKPTSITFTTYTDSTMVTPLATYISTTTYDATGNLETYTVIKQ